MIFVFEVNQWWKGMVRCNEKINENTSYDMAGSCITSLISFTYKSREFISYITLQRNHAPRKPIWKDLASTRSPTLKGRSVFLPITNYTSNLYSRLYTAHTNHTSISQTHADIYPITYPVLKRKQTVQKPCLQSAERTLIIFEQQSTERKSISK